MRVRGVMCHDLLDTKLSGVQFSLLLLGLEMLVICIQRKSCSYAALGSENLPPPVHICFVTSRKQ
jgi:hypothetical protein